VGRGLVVPGGFEEARSRWAARRVVVGGGW